ncbi:MAG: family 43 glycosylhydrolase [Lentisphaerae bacterium]|jgi:hypothetical protein|nr:family 43 glycosylhydrolase [Lentisphaerota bacterium]MBT4818230.1 family 43 glycosylhydrolase [Lentisphaerota bacterium]MBT5613013.1 family 43 glycosylhydrolase [Lentisphaerota bacterium]MBT7056741.1 family 43 glycosylhydrolase [Lentisphaerota bacterium]MBT7843741.1 family 43 glycosylhydrolase [Lentisphaerota bacterium]
MMRTTQNAVTAALLVALATQGTARPDDVTQGVDKMQGPRWHAGLKQETPTVLPMPSGSVRESSVIHVDGTWYMYADVVPWSSPHHPNTYDTGIHLFTSRTGADWKHRGRVLEGTPGTWDEGGTATPGAVSFAGQVWLFYSGRERRNGRGHRHIGLALATDPEGPFKKLGGPAIDGPGAKDDPCPVVSPGKDEVRLYFRRATGTYSIDLATTRRPRGPWEQHGPVVEAHGDLRATESTDAKVIDGVTLLAVMEQYHSPGKGIRTVLYAARDGRAFIPCNPDCFEDVVTIRHGHRMGSHLTFHQDDTGKIKRLGVTRVLDANGHYSRCLFDTTFAW